MDGIWRAMSPELSVAGSRDSNSVRLVCFLQKKQEFLTLASYTLFHFGETLEIFKNGFSSEIPPFCMAP
jgi:hypothetical protein